MNSRLRVGTCLSLSGRFAQFGRQAARGLKAWQSLDGNADLLIEDDRSDKHNLEAVLPDLVERCDVLLGPYSTVLARAAGGIAADSDRLVWNHGGSGDDVQQAHPGHVISVLTPTSRYGEPFVRNLADGGARRDLYVVHGQGRFGRQVADGAAAAAEQLGITVMRATPDDFPPGPLPRDWDLFSAGVFEQDAALTAAALQLPQPPRQLCSVSAGVRKFARSVGNPEGVFGVAQWFPGGRRRILLGPGEEEFMTAYASAAGGDVPDYPAVQAAAGAVIASHCARLAGSSRREELWAAAVDLDTSTLFGGFRVDRASGTQVKHEMSLVRWTRGELAAVTAHAA